MIIALLVAGGALLVSLLDPMGLETNSERLSDDVAEYVADPLYGGRGRGEAPRGQGRITVITLGEETRQLLGKLWKGFPPSYDNEMALLNDVAYGSLAPKGPSAIFMDFTFLSTGRDAGQFEHFRNAIDALTKASPGDKSGPLGWSNIGACANDEVIKIACIVAAGGTPVILGGQRSIPLDPMIDDGLAGLYRVAVISNLLVGEREYPLLDPPSTMSKPGHEANSPAALLYVADRIQKAIVNCDKAGAKTEYDRLACSAKNLVHPATAQVVPSQDYSAQTHQASKSIRRALNGAFAVDWSSTPPPEVDTLSQELYGRASDCPEPDQKHWVSAWGSAAGRFAARLSPWRLRLYGEEEPNGGQEEARAVCPYALSLSYGAFATSGGLKNASRNRLFAEKLVLIGSASHDSNDWMPSVVHGRLPGVYYHAMALDNLLESEGPHYKIRRINNLTEPLSRGFTASLIFLLVFIGGWHEIARNDLGVQHIDLPAEDQDRRRKAIDYLWLHVKFALADIVFMFGAAFLAISSHVPINWIAALTVVVGERILTKVEKVSDDLHPIVHNWPPIIGWRWLVGRLSLHEEVLLPPKTTRISPSPDRTP